MRTLFRQGYKLKFYEVYENVEQFEEEFYSSPFNSDLYVDISLDTIKLTYALLTSRYYNYCIANNEQWFKLNVAKVMAEFGPTFEKQLKVQKELLELSEEEIEKGTRQVYNRASNPEMTPSTSSLSELPFINEQTSTNVKKSKVDARIDYLDVITHINYQEIYLDHFKRLFSSLLGSTTPVLYESEDDE